jgi:hypothetical protein
MSDTHRDSKTEAQIESGTVPPAYQTGGDGQAIHSEKGISAERAGAIQAEEDEFKMGVVQAVKEYPMAALWAFIMSCTIVSTSQAQLPTT